MNDALMSTYARLPVRLVRGEGARVWDDEGREYLDALAGIAVCGLGHAHPDVTAALADQAAQLVHCSNNYRIPAQEELGRRLTAVSGHERAFFCNSGAEANETALKIARRHGHARGIEQPAVIVCERAFHGRTLATISASGNPKIQAGFEPLMPGFLRVPFDDLEAIERIATEHDNVVAVLVEPVQGEGGIRVSSAGYLPGLRRLCDRHGWLLMFDEIQSGVGRTGAWFAQHHAGVTGDVTTVAKALGNGVPIGACVARGAAAEVLVPGSHGTTFGGNPLACRVGLAVLERIEADRLVEQADRRGRRILDGLGRRLGGHPGVREVRGQGLMIGVELAHDCAALVARALEAGLLINVTGGNVIRLLPPLIIDERQADAIVDRVADLAEAFLAEQDTVSA